MVQTAVELGYEYIAIYRPFPLTLPPAATFQADDVRRQADEIATVRERYGQITILHGCEVDILRDGRLDFPDKILERFDIVAGVAARPREPGARAVAASLPSTPCAIRW